MTWIASVSPFLLQALSETSFRTIPPLVLKVSNLIRPYFLLGQNAAVLAFGIKELTWDQKAFQDVDLALIRSEKIKLFGRNFFLNFKCWIGPFNHSHIHGGLYIASGVCGAFDYAIRALGLPFELVANFLSWAGQATFALANIFSITYYSHVFYKSFCQPATTAVEQEALKRIRLSAVLGIINNLGYLTAALLSAFGGPVTMALVFGGVALLTGCIKILFDYFVFS